MMMARPLKEIVLRQYFEGHATASELDMAGSASVERRSGPDDVPIIDHHVEEMAVEFHVRPEHIVKLVDDVLARRIGLPALDAICFCLEATTNFSWNADSEEGSRVADAVFWLGTPEVNYPLNDDVLRKVRRYLESGENTLTAADTRRVAR